MTAKEIIRILLDDDWYEVKGSGSSHRQFKHPTKKGKVTVPEHGGDIAPGTLSSIKRQAKLK